MTKLIDVKRPTKAGWKKNCQKWSQNWYLR